MNATDHLNGYDHVNDSIRAEGDVPIAEDKPKPRNNILLVMMCCLVMLDCSGCATYFRTGEMGYQEIKEQNAELEKQKHMMFQPGTSFGSWTL